MIQYTIPYRAELVKSFRKRYMYGRMSDGFTICKTAV